jgi:hypothetical protein
MIWSLLVTCLPVWTTFAYEISTVPSYLHGIDWSHQSMKLRRGPDLHIYHNYTIEDDGLTNSTRFLSKEVIPRHNQVLQYRGPTPLRPQVHKKLEKRGFFANPDVSQEEAVAINNEDHRASKRYVTWNWQRPNTHCPALIQFCFPDAVHQSALKPIVDAAFEMWADALGEDRGVRFLYTRANPDQGVSAGICISPQNAWVVTNDAVVVARAGGGLRAYNGVGWTPWGPPGAGRMAVHFDPGTDGSAAALAENIATMAHELGKLFEQLEDYVHH